MYIAYALYSYMQHSYFSSKYNGDGEIRTLDPLLARQVLSQLSYTPMDAGLPSFEAIPYSFYLFKSASHLLHYLFR